MAENSNNFEYQNYLTVEDIKNKLNDIVDKKQKLDFLIKIRDEFIKVCYFYNDKEIENYMRASLFEYEYFSIPYSKNTDYHKTHISHSVYITLLRQIDSVLLPFIREEISKINPDIKEDISSINCDYKLFDLDLNKILDNSETMGEKRIDYLYCVLNDLESYWSLHTDSYQYHDMDNYEYYYYINYTYKKQKIEERIFAIKRYPDVKYEKYSDTEKLLSESRIKRMTDYFDSHPDLYWFSVNEIKKHAENFPSIADRIIYLEYVAKELQMHKEYVLAFETEDINIFLDVEIKYYEKIKPYKLQSASDNITPVQAKEPIRLHWQDDNALIPYLIKLLHEEGFISPSDWENRKDFIEQSFIKNNGSVFKSTEVPAVEQNNSLTKTGKPQKSYKVERAIGKLKSKREEINQKSKLKPKK